LPPAVPPRSPFFNRVRTACRSSVRRIELIGGTASSWPPYAMPWRAARGPRTNYATALTMSLTESSSNWARIAREGDVLPVSAGRGRDPGRGWPQTSAVGLRPFLAHPAPAPCRPSSSGFSSNRAMGLRPSWATLRREPAHRRPSALRLHQVHPGPPAAGERPGHSAFIVPPRRGPATCSRSATWPSAKAGRPSCP